MKKQTLYALIAALIILQLYSAVKINTLQSGIERADDSIRSAEDRLDNQIGSISQNIEQKLEEQASLIRQSSANVGKLDTDTLTVPVTFTVAPKRVAETTAVSLDFGGEVVPLEKSGLEYSATKDFGILEDIFPTVVIEDDQTKHTEDHPGLRVSNLREKIFPYIFAGFSGQSSYGGKEYSAKGMLTIDYKPSQENNPLTEIKYVIKVDDGIVKETPVALTGKSGSGGAFTLDIDEKYSINDGQVLTSHVVAADSLGFTYEYLVTHFVAGSNVQREPYFKQEKITAPDGKVVYQSGEKDYK